VHVEPPTQLLATLLMLDAVVDSVLGEPPPVVNCVDVIVRFQPLPLPVASVTVVGTVYEAVLSVPSSVMPNDGVALVVRLSVPADTVPVTVLVAATAGDARTAPATSVLKSMRMRCIR
jgi:hypothetical protein